MTLIFEEGRVAECNPVKVTEGNAQLFALSFCGLEPSESSEQNDSAQNLQIFIEEATYVCKDCECATATWKNR
jgi:hypothetical protein